MSPVWIHDLHNYHVVAMQDESSSILCLTDAFPLNRIKHDLRMVSKYASCMNKCMVFHAYVCVCASEGVRTSVCPGSKKGGAIVDTARATEAF